MCQLFQHCVMEISWSPDLIGLSSLCSYLESSNFYSHNLTAACLCSVVTILGLLNPKHKPFSSILISAWIMFPFPSSYSKVFSHCSFWFLRQNNILPFPINISFKVSLSLDCGNCNFIPVFLDFLLSLVYGENFLPFAL